MRPLTAEQQRQQEGLVSRVETALTLIYGQQDVYGESEDLEVAKARLENWLAENKGRWVA
jgi:hypothetical protein